MKVRFKVTFNGHRVFLETPDAVQALVSQLVRKDGAQVQIEDYPTPHSFPSDVDRAKALRCHFTLPLTDDERESVQRLSSAQDDQSETRENG